jgi:cytochrome c biogenesis protein CcmG, thiol:disulfide interchange protein DsbE
MPASARLRQGLRIVVWQVREACHRHGVGAAAAGDGRAGETRQTKERHCRQKSQHADLHHGRGPRQFDGPRSLQQIRSFCPDSTAAELRQPSPEAGRSLGLPHSGQLLALLIAGVVWLTISPRAASAEPEIGKAAPALVGTTIDGKIFDLAQLRGKVVLVNYWATWCAPCRKEMPKFDAFYKRYHAEGLEIVGISIDFDRDIEKARKAARNVSYPTTLAKAITDDGFGIPKAVPITWVIDTDGKVRDRLIEVRDELLNDIVVPLLPRGQ